MDLQYMLDFMMGERMINLKHSRVTGVREHDLSEMHGADGIFVVLDRWREPVPARIMDYVKNHSRLVIWHHDDLHLARRSQR
jgi:hypothetical protein